MGRAIDYDEAREILEILFKDADEDFRNGKVPQVPQIVDGAVEILFKSSTQSFREALLGCALARYIDGDIDIRLPYMRLGTDAFGGRTLDERVINPFLNAHEIPCSKGPYLATFRRSVAFTPETQRGVRDKDAFAAMLTIIDQLQAGDDADVSGLLIHLLYKFIELREKSNITLAQIKRLSVDQYAEIITKLLGTPSGGLLPVLLTVAIFAALKETYNLPWEIEFQGINVADAASGAGGDVTVSIEGRTLIAVEVTERTIDESRVRSTFRTKILPNKIEDYLFLFSGESPSGRARTRASSYFAQGHEVNFLPLQSWIMTFLTTLGPEGRMVFTDCVIKALDRNEVPARIKIVWNDVVRELTG